MRLCRFVTTGQSTPRFGAIVDDAVIDVAASGGPGTLADGLRLPSAEFLAAMRGTLSNSANSIPIADITLLAPIDAQEVWAAGVTYLRSRDARMEESTQQDVYDLVYEADRPEIFFKATPNRVSGPGEPVAVRSDSGWDVPEPELVVIVNALGEVVGYTIGNDVSSRSIEGENPLYLPQAKLYARSAALGPAIVTRDELDDVSNLEIALTVRRGENELLHDVTSTSQLHRTVDDLISYLFRANEFPSGVFLMTGTGIVPPSDFTLRGGDEVTIRIDGLGSLVNPVVQIEA